MVFAVIVLSVIISCAFGAPNPNLPPPIFRNECADSRLHDCPETSTCIDLPYNFMCQCKDGLVDQSPDKKKNPGRICVTKDGAPPPPPPPPPSPVDTSAESQQQGPSTGADNTDQPEVTHELTDDQNNNTDQGHHQSHPQFSTPLPNPEELARDDGEEDKSGRDETKEAFKAFDGNGDGKITLDELRSATKKNNMHLSDANVKSMLKKADANEDGTVNMVEFQKFMHGRKSH